MRFRVAAPGILAFVVLASEARAEPPGMRAPTPPPKHTAPAHRSPALALGLSLGVTGAGFALSVAAASRHAPDPAPLMLAVGVTYIGPSIGRWYGGGSAAIGLLTRAAGIGLIGLGIAEDHPIDDCIAETPGECDGHDRAVAERDRKVKTLVFTGAALWIASSVYDFVHAPLDAREFNREHAVTVAPTVLRGGGQGGSALVPGLAVQGRF
jgi:hypothetical protein